MPDGSYGKFNSGVSDDVIRSAVMKDFPNAYKASVPTESQAAANPTVAPVPGASDIQNAWQQHEAKREQLQGRQQRAMRSPTPFTNASAVLAPVTAIRQILGGKIGGYAGAKAAPYVGASPETGAFVGGTIGSLGAGVAPSVAENASRLTLEAPEKIQLPFGYKINRNVPPNPYEQMGKSAQYRGMARESMAPPPAEVDPVAAAVKSRTANWIPTKVTPPGEEQLPLPMRAHAEMNQDIAEARQGRASARQEMYGDLAQARAARPDQLTQAMREGRAAKLPIRMPRPAVPESQSPFAGLPSSSPSDTAASPQPKLPFLPSASESTTTGAPAAIVPKGATPKKSLIVEPGSEPPDVKVTYQSVPQPDLLQKVMSGDKLAITEWQRRGLQLPPNVGYMVESGAGTLPWRNYRK